MTATLLTSACSGGLFGTVGPDYMPPSSQTPPAWQASQDAGVIAHEGSTRRLADWWAQFKDPALDALIAAAQAQSATLAQAAASIERARADAIAAGVAAYPNLDAIASANRSAFTLGGPVALRTQSQIGLQSSWEIDLFGGLARQREAREASLAANVAQWHDARVSLAAEVANAYLNLRHCEVLVAQAEADVVSRTQSARLTGISAQAGFQSDSAADLSKATAADSAAILAQRRGQCEISVKGLVSLTGMDEPALRKMLTQTRAGGAKLPEPARFQIDALPARIIAQRPDIAAAERQLASASAEIGAAEANRYPRLTLAGNITPTRMTIDNGPTLSVTTWSIGPSLVLPLLDGGRRSANVDAARAQYASAEAAYRAKVRNAVREVEEALVRLSAAADREAQAAAAARGYRSRFEAVQTMQRAGLGNLFDLEEARRLLLNADATLAVIAQERVAAWIALYRAAGGGWDADTPLAAR
jgi:multidrug efflux system outer membrane protein